MATYNCEKYIKQQIDSIILNLTDNDEIVISDDGSTDETLSILREYEKQDKRIKLISGPQKGVKQNFANAIKNTNGKYIFLSDQDDIWMENKVDRVLETFEKSECTLVIHDAKVTNGDLEEILPSFFSYRNSKKGVFKNILKNTYIGCCMAFDAKIKYDILPIPNNIEMHDQWIGIISELKGKNVFLKERLINYRRHENNVSKMQHYSVTKMLKNRIIFIVELFKYRMQRSS
ncbi:MAG: glycosyltransferase family 2 protein [Clostridia bacterium]|nr:glycosyltransferase family 2 protein [Clostridia bacterium]